MSDSRYDDADDDNDDSRAGKQGEQAPRRMTDTSSESNSSLTSFQLHSQSLSVTITLQQLQQQFKLLNCHRQVTATNWSQHLDDTC